MHCSFCRIIEGRAPARIVYQDEDVTVFHDREPRAPVHLLIVPNEHIQQLSDSVDLTTIADLINAATVIAAQIGLKNGYRLHINTGPYAHQTVPHLHVHLTGGRPLPVL